ncbi:MAG TPA: tetratricopeptide repeat protein, partial [Lacipirellulaceae bacterium]|nr:tetratricopeptide repeat protein [Lacipirellulaceae bacterium]
MSLRTSLGAVARYAAAIAAIVSTVAVAQVSAQAQPAGSDPSTAANPAGSGGDAAARDAILKALTVETLIGDAVSLSNQQYPEVESAIKRFINGDVVGAREFLEVAKKKYPKLPPTDLTLAKMQVIVRNGQAARAFLEKAVAENPGDPEAYLLLADLAFVEGRVTEAHALFEKANGLTANFTENEKRKNNFTIRVLAGLAAVHERRLQWPEANALLMKWIAIDPDSAVAHQRLGATLYRLQKSAEALAEFTKARELDPNSNHPQVWLGQLFTQDKKLAEARKAFEAAYAAEPANETTSRAYAEWLIQQNDLDKAQSVAAAMRQKTPESVTAILLDGVVAKMRGQNDAAEEALMKVLTIDPNNSIATNLLALILSESKEPADLERAFGYAQRNAALFPGNTQTNITLAWVLYQMGRLSDANQILARGIQNPSADAAYLIARIMEAQNQQDKAAAVLKEVLEQSAGGVFLYRRDAEAMMKRLTDAGVTIPPGGIPTDPGPAATTPPATGAGGAAPGAAAPTGTAPATAAP